MPDFFSFTQGTEASARFPAASDASPLLGRFRAVPAPRRRAGSNPLLGPTAAGWRGSVHVGYGALLARELDDAAVDDDDDDGDSASEAGSGADGEGGAPARLWAHPGPRRGARRFGRRTLRWVRDVWVSPRQGAVRKAVGRWWSRWLYLVVLPASLVGIPYSLDVCCWRWHAEVGGMG